ncbi:serine acetyltransferase [Kosakonia sp. 1610]|uniref:serine acetyltransferase n=1 Tax=Kosakonia sp. 1610 TaxID=3156426 RepID=UPI003D1FC8FB
MNNPASKEFLKECLYREVLKGDTKPFSWMRAIRKGAVNSQKRFYFWFRVYKYVSHNNKFFLGKYAKSKYKKLCLRYGVDIHIRAVIGPGLHIGHYHGLVIKENIIIGKNFDVRQGTTIGNKKGMADGVAIIGDNVTIGANSCIIGKVNIGDNATIGAHTFINKDVPANTTVYNRIETVVTPKN